MRKREIIKFPTDEPHLDFKAVVDDCCQIEYIVTKINQDQQTDLRTVKQKDLIAYDNKKTTGR